MSRPLGQLLIFLSIVFVVLGGIHYYLWVRLVRNPGLPAPWRTVATVALVLLALSLPLTMMLSRALPPHLARWITFPAFVWMGAMFFLFVGLVVSDVLRVALLAVAKLRGLSRPDPSRREFLARVSAGAVAAAAGGATAAAVLIGTSRPRVKEVRVALPRLPRELDGFSIAQLTDVHIGPTLHRDFLADVVARTNALSPDLVAITGDLVDGTVDHLREHTAPLAELSARQGTYFVTGNHEYYSGVDEWMVELKRLGVRTLRNERVSIGNAGDSFDLAGVDDYSARGNGHGPDLQRALAGRDPARELVLLAHQPRQFVTAAQQGVGLQLSGHTHGGQIWPWSYMVYLQQPFLVGRFREGASQLYVSPGTGYWGPPMRLGTRSEITRLILQGGEPPRRA